MFTLTDIALAVPEKVKSINLRKYNSFETTQINQNIDVNIWVNEPKGFTNGFSYILRCNSNSP